MEFRLLGPLAVGEGEKTASLGGPKQRAVLASLLVRANRVVSTDRLIDDLWGEAPPATARNTLQRYISHLRHALDEIEPDRLLTREPGYLLVARDGEVDASRFEELAREGHALLGSDAEAAAARFDTALALWSGPVLADLADEPALRPEITRLEDLRLGVIEDRIQAHLDLGRHVAAVGQLETLTEEHPYRERLWVHLMIALYRSGRQADALRSFQRLRRLLGEELGIEPSPELRRLEEQMLLQDPALQPAPDVGELTLEPAVILNPYKGLRAFQEGDTADFFGREALVTQLVESLSGTSRLVAVVGPSGSGKSSVVRAGLIPALRKGALPGSDLWLIAQMLPGSHPFAELEAALLRSTLDPPDSLTDQLSDESQGLLRAALRVLPDDESRLLLIIDQFEELFLLVEDEDVRRRLLANLITVLNDPRGRVHVVVTLRADFYDRPLLYPEFGTLLASNMVSVMPLTTEELEAAAVQPARGCGVSFEPTLLGELIADVTDQPGALPLFQYILTELFDRRAGNTLTAADYRSMKGLRGALTRRADDLFNELDREQKEEARQLFLRLVTITEHDEWSRRRVPASEIVSLATDLVTMQAVIDQFGRHRLLSFDRDQISGAPTVEVAHEALLHEWTRLRKWIEESREDVRRRATFAVALGEWLKADRDPDYLLTGRRLAEYETWSESSSIKLTSQEREYLAAGITRREEEAVAAEYQRTQESRLRRRARTRLWTLAAAITALVAIGVVFLVVALQPRGPKVAFVFAGRGDQQVNDLAVSGLDRAVRELTFEAEEVVPLADPSDEIRHLSETGTGLIVVAGGFLGQAVATTAAEFPDTSYVIVDGAVSGFSNVTSLVYATEEGSYLAGAAAALKSDSGIIGFVGAMPIPEVEDFRAGYEAGARAVNPDIDILAIYIIGRDDITVGEDLATAFNRPDLGRATARILYEQGADVVYHVAGASGFGVFDAAREQTEIQGRHLWAIGVDSDQYLNASDELRPHILTSMVKRVDVAVYDSIKDFVEGALQPELRRLTLADEGMELSTSGDFLGDDMVGRLDQLEARIVGGEIRVPHVPTGSTIPPPDVSP